MAKVLAHGNNGFMPFKRSREELERDADIPRVQKNVRGAYVIYDENHLNPYARTHSGFSDEDIQAMNDYYNEIVTVDVVCKRFDGDMDKLSHHEAVQQFDSQLERDGFSSDYEVTLSDVDNYVAEQMSERYGFDDYAGKTDTIEEDQHNYPFMGEYVPDAYDRRLNRFATQIVMMDEQERAERDGDEYVPAPEDAINGAVCMVQDSLRGGIAKAYSDLSKQYGQAFPNTPEVQKEWEGFEDANQRVCDKYGYNGEQYKGDFYESEEGIRRRRVANQRGAIMNNLEETVDNLNKRPKGAPRLIAEMYERSAGMPSKGNVNFEENFTGMITDRLDDVDKMIAGKAKEKAKDEAKKQRSSLLDKFVEDDAEKIQKMNEKKLEDDVFSDEYMASMRRR